MQLLREKNPSGQIFAKVRLKYYLYVIGLPGKKINCKASGTDKKSQVHKLLLTRKHLNTG